MPRTENPNNWYDAVSCGLCGITYQVLVPVLDEATGEQAVNEEGRPLFTQDPQAPTDELIAHMEDWHPETDQTDESGQPVRAHVGEAPPD